jgi:N-acetylmuramoyl-L-alanine amidase
MSLVTITGTAALPDSAYRRRLDTTLLVMHCAQTTATQDFDAADIRGWHVKENGWIDIGYHYVITRRGIVQRGRPKWAVGSHVAGFNGHSLGICLVGGCNAQKQEENNFTDAQWYTLERLTRDVLAAFPTITDICGHRDLPNVRKYCPSFDVSEWLHRVGITA